MLSQPTTPLCGPPALVHKRVVGVVAEIEVMRGEAGVDQRPLLGLRIVHRQLPRRTPSAARPWPTDDRSPPCRMPGWRAGRMRAVNQTRPSSSIIGLWMLVWLSQIGVVAPDRPRCHAAWSWTTASSDRERVLDRGQALFCDRIEHRHEVGALLRRAVDRAVGVDGRVALVGRDLVVQVVLRRRPVPHADHDVALDALRPLRLGERQFARGDAVGPVGESCDALVRARCAPMVDAPCWSSPGRTGCGASQASVEVLEAAEPSATACGCLVEPSAWQRLAGVLDRVDPVALGLHDRRDAVALGAGARKFALGRNLEHRVPVHARIVFGGGGRRRRRRSRSGSTSLPGRWSPSANRRVRSRAPRRV